MSRIERLRNAQVRRQGIQAVPGNGSVTTAQAAVPTAVHDGPEQEAVSTGTVLPRIPPQGGSSTAPPKEQPAGAVLTYACGHKEELHQISGRKCPGCRNAVSRDRAARKEALRAARRLEGSGEAERPFRLPAGSVKKLAWDGTQWLGTLEVPGEAVFTFAGDTERETYHGLHDAYVAWLREGT